MSIIQLRNITKTYGDHCIFKNFCLNVNEGEFIAITGKSGHGKTTLLNIIGLLELPDSGTVTIFGLENPTLDSKKGRMLLSKRISYLFQNYGLIEDKSVEYNIRVGLHSTNIIGEKIIITIFKLIDLLLRKTPIKLDIFRSFIDKKKSMIDSINEALISVGLSGYEKKKIYELSGGEQQRVALARLMVKPTDIILADEPTGSLDPDNRQCVMEILKKMNSLGKTIIVVTHDKEVSKYASRIEKI